MRFLLLFIFLLSYFSPMSAQKTITDLIKNIPQDIIPYLNDSQQKEFERFLGENDTVEIKNIFDGTLSVYTVGNDFASIKPGDAVELQIKVLSINDSLQIICLVETIDTPVKESHVSFYSTDWHLLKNRFGLPDYSELINKFHEMFLCKPQNMTSVKYLELSKSIEPIIISANFAKQSDLIVFSLSLPLMSKEQRDETKAITKQACFKWNGCLFEEFHNIDNKTATQ